MNNQAGVLVMMNRADEAVTCLHHSLAITNSPATRLNLALTYFKAQNFSAAETEYRRLEKESPDAFRIHSGLADIALQRHDTNAGIHDLEICLASVPVRSPRWISSQALLDELKPPRLRLKSQL